jgi:DNA-binding LacI/PurR family transcriptional regulator
MEQWKKMRKAVQIKDKLLRCVERYRRTGQSRLPSERALAEELGCSRATVGKALGVLEAEGIVDRRAGAGTFIVDVEAKGTVIALAMRHAYQCTDNHFASIVKAVSGYAEKLGVGIRIFDDLTEQFTKKPTDNPLIESIENKEIDGVLIISRLTLKIASAISAVCPTVSINNTFGDGSEIPSVTCDYFRTGFLAGKHLQQKGHRRIAFATKTLEHTESSYMLSGLKSALEGSGIDFSESDIIETGENLNTYKKRLIDFFYGNDYTACFVRSCVSAVRMMPILQKRGIDIPNALYFVASGSSMDKHRGLKVIDNRIEKMSQVGFELLMNYLKNDNTVERGIKLLPPVV